MGPRSDQAGISTGGWIGSESGPRATKPRVVSGVIPDQEASAVVVL